MHDQNSLPFLTRQMLAFEGATSFSISIDLWSLATNDLFLSGFTKEGQFSFKIVPDGTGALQTFNFSLPDVPIALTLQPATTSSEKADVYGVVYLRMNTDRVLQLVRGYVHVQGGMTWPAAGGEDAIPNLGHPRLLNGANPAAGAEVTITVPENKIWVLHAVNFELVTDANVGNRRVKLNIIPGSGNGYVLESATDQAPSLTRQYSCVALGSVQVEAFETNIIINIPQKLVLPEGSQINTITTNLEATDNYDVPKFLVEEYILEQ